MLRCVYLLPLHLFSKEQQRCRRIKSRISKRPLMERYETSNPSTALSRATYKGFQRENFILWSHTAVYIVPSPLNCRRRLPSVLGVPKPHSKQMSSGKLSVSSLFDPSDAGEEPSKARSVYIPFSLAVDEAVSRMEQPEIVDVLNIPLGKMRAEAEFLAEEMKCIQGFSLRFCYRRDVGAARKLAEAHKEASCVLKADPLGSRRRGRVVKHDWPWSPLLLRVFLEALDSNN